MSGGSHNYIYLKLLSECDDRMYDVEMNDMIHDLADLLHDLEWWQSGDYSEDQYRQSLAEFKKKWFKGSRRDRLKEYIDNQLGIVRRQLYETIGEPIGESKEDKK